MRNLHPSSFIFHSRSGKLGLQFPQLGFEPMDAFDQHKGDGQRIRIQVEVIAQPAGSTHGDCTIRSKAQLSDTCTAGASALTGTNVPWSTSSRSSAGDKAVNSASC